MCGGRAYRVDCEAAGRGIENAAGRGLGRRQKFQLSQPLENHNYNKDLRQLVCNKMNICKISNSFHVDLVLQRFISHISTISNCILISLHIFRKFL